MVFLHGYSLSAQAWARVLPLLPAAWRAYALDMRGFGQSGKPALKQTLLTMYASPAISPECLTAIQVPTLIIVGKHDPYGTFDQAVALSDCIPNSRIAVMPRCGHSPMWEKPQEYVGILTDFLCP